MFIATFADVMISMAIVTGAVLMVLTGCLSMDEAYQSIEWRSVFLIDRFFDFIRVGAPLNLALFLVTMIFLPIIWPLY